MKVEAHGLAMKVRARESFSHRMNYYREGDVCSLDWDEAFFLLDFGRVAPVFDLKIYRPLLDLDGLTIWEACLHHVREFPPLKPFLENANAQFRPSYLYVRQFAIMPKWHGVGEKGPSPEDCCQRSLRYYLRRVAIHFFLERLANQELNVVGVSESDLKTLMGFPIPSGWWRRNILLDFRTNEIWEHVVRGPNKNVRRFSEIRILQPDEAQERSQPGRRSNRKKLVKAFNELWSSGSLTRDDLKNKKGVRNKVLEHLGYAPETPGCSYQSFVAHVGPVIDEVLQIRDSEN